MRWRHNDPCKCGSEMNESSDHFGCWRLFRDLEQERRRASDLSHAKWKLDDIVRELGAELEIEREKVKAAYRLVAEAQVKAEAP